MRVRSALSYCEPPLAGKIAPMSQRKGIKIPMIPNATYPFLKVSKHTVKRQTMYTVKSRDAKNQMQYPLCLDQPIPLPQMPPLK